MQNDSKETKAITSTKDLPSEVSGVQDKSEKTTNSFTFDWSPSASPTLQEQVARKRTTNNEEIVIYDDFERMGLSDAILRGVFALGFEKPSVIQQRAIVPCVEGRDVVAQAQSGSGKTATFSIAVLQQLDMKQKRCQVIYSNYIHSPTVCNHVRVAN